MMMRIITPFRVGLLCSLLFYTSCIFQDEQVCDSGIDYIYTYNTESDDQFHETVNLIHLDVYDMKGNYLFTKQDTGTLVQNKSYLMNLYFPAGEYQLVAWGERTVTEEDVRGSLQWIDGGENFNGHIIDDIIPDDNQENIDDAVVELPLSSKKTSDGVITPLWNGYVSRFVSDGTGQIQQVNLLKLTKRIRLICQEYRPGDAGFHMDDFQYEIHGHNSVIYYDAEVEPEAVTYLPYFKKQVDEQTAVMEFSILRLLVDDHTSLVIRNKADGQEVFHIDLTSFLLLTEMEGHDWTPQEYLDRQDEYVVSVFFDAETSPSGQSHWGPVKIIVNDWVVYQQSDEV